MELLNEDRQRELIAQPESGMGYQDVAIELRNGETRYGTAFNAEEIELPDDCAQSEIEDIQLHR